MKRACFSAALQFAASTAFATTVTFTEYPFPTTQTNYTDSTGSLAPPAATLPFNLLSDTSGALLTADDGGSADITLHIDSVVVSPTGRVVTRWQPDSSGRINNNVTFGAPPVSPDLAYNIARTFVSFDASRFRISNFVAQLLSMNTAGASWEFTLLGLKRPDGSAFSPVPTLLSYQDYQAQGVPGFIGSPSPGWYLCASTKTVTGVGTAQTSPGVSSSCDNATLTLADFALPSDTLIGSFEWRTVLQDVRGSANGAASFGSSLASFSFDADVIPVPEPSSFTLVLAGTCLMGWLRGRGRRHAPKSCGS